MENASRPQKPFASPQALSTFSGPIPVANMAPMKTMMLRMMANRKASGSQRLTTRTQPLVNFLNTDSLSLIWGRGAPRCFVFRSAALYAADPSVLIL